MAGSLRTRLLQTEPEPRPREWAELEPHEKADWARETPTLALRGYLASTMKNLRNDIEALWPKMDEVELRSKLAEIRALRMTKALIDGAIELAEETDN